MAITTILFDLDGTLLPMDLDNFIKAYFEKIAAWLAPHGFEKKLLKDTIWRGTSAMVKNDGSRTNEAVFWATLETVYGAEIRNSQDVFDCFYDKEFDSLKNICGFQPSASGLINKLKKRGYRLILATNPLFPRPATHWRIRWAGLKPEDFEYITTYENSSFCKPNPLYYRSILQTLDAKPEQCLMIGNDMIEDMAAAELGMEVFLLTDCLINKQNADISQYRHGDFTALMDYLCQL